MSAATGFSYAPRPHFEAFHRRTQKKSLMVCHRRAGKTVACVGDLIAKAYHCKKANPRFAYVAPFRQQAKEIAWTYLKALTDGIRIGKPRESELRVKIPTVTGQEAWVTLYGADNPDALRGLYFDGIVLDEFGDMKPSLMSEVITPCLADRDGWLVIIGTAKGRNQFYDYHLAAQESDEWFHNVLKASESGILPQDKLDEMREVMGDDQYEQEMECNFDAAVSGTFYAAKINALERAGRVVFDRRLYNPAQKVHVAADLGQKDASAWWFWQPLEDGYNIIDYYAATGKYCDHYLHMLFDKKYEYAAIWLPFDSKNKTIQSKRSTAEQIRYPHQTAINYEDKALAKKYPGHVVMPVRAVLSSCTFDGETCHDGLDALRSYRKRYHDHLQTYSEEPIHDWASDGADGFRYLSLVVDHAKPQPVENPNSALPSLGIGQQPGAPAGYRLDDLFKDRERGRRSGIIRIA